MRSPSALLASVLFVVLAIAVPATAQADGSPDISLATDAPARVLYGEHAGVTLRVTNPSAGSTYGYNLTFRDVLPAGVAYVPGSAPVEPLQIDDAPGSGETTLIFQNVADLSAGSTYELHYEVAHDPDELGVGDSYTNAAEAYVQTNPRLVPKFDSLTGEPLAGSSTGSAGASTPTTIAALTIDQDEPSPEGELMRGLHDHQTVYTLRVRNNAVNPTTGVTVDDYLPAGLEFLGCGTEDNTTDAPTNPGSTEEYPGAGAIDPGNEPAGITPANCVAPASVTTESVDPDGDGPLGTGIYTHVVWTSAQIAALASLAASDEVELKYVAAIPLRENALTWTTDGGAPSPESGKQAANLDNNSGAETAETGTERPLGNVATASGTYDGSAPVDDTSTLTRTAEDLAIQKSVSSGTIVQGQLSTWTLDVETSEYRTVHDLVVTDTLPDGLCPLGPQNYENPTQQNAECDSDGTSGPSMPYTSVDEHEDGSFTIVWDKSTAAALAGVGPSQHLQITFPTRTRASYQEDFEDDPDHPILAHDSWTNHVHLSGDDDRICAPADADCTGGGAPIDGDEVDGEPDEDDSSASQVAGGVTLDKTIHAGTPTPIDCDTGAYIDEHDAGYPPHYAPGDTVCWELRVDFATSLNTGGPALRDFLPAGTTYVPGSAQPTSANTVTATLVGGGPADGVLEWSFGPDDSVAPTKVFAWRFATTVDGTSFTDGVDILGNLAKLSYANTSGQSFTLRDRVDFEREEASLSLVKGVQDVNHALSPVNGPNVDGVLVKGSDVVTYRVDVTNDGERDATGTKVMDRLPPYVGCTMVGNISAGGACLSDVAGDRIVWTGLTVAAGGTQTLTYDVQMPAQVDVGYPFQVNTAGVVSYQSDTNDGGSFVYVPDDNIDADAPDPNAPAAKDFSWVATAPITLVKVRSTTVTDDGNAGADQATIGELVKYTLTATVPGKATIYGSPRIVDTLDARQQVVTAADGAPADPVATYNSGSTLPAGVGLSWTAGAVTLGFPATYTQSTPADGTFVITFYARVLDVAANKRTGSSFDYLVLNSANFLWKSAAGVSNAVGAFTSTTIVEPNLQVTKSDNDADGVVSSGQIVTYTVTATNASGTRVSAAHDVDLTDVVPPGLTPLQTDGVTPADDGDAVDANGGIWHAGSNTISWPSIASIAPGATATRTYKVRVDPDQVVAATFENAAHATGTSMAGTVTGERTAASTTNPGYEDDDSVVVHLAGAQLTKSVAPTTGLTIGSKLTYTLDVVFPAHVLFYDATVLDQLPDGIVYDGTTSVTCTAGCDAGDPTPVTLPEQTSAGATKLGWFIGDLPALATDRTVQIVYTAHVGPDYDGGALVDAGDALTNTAGVSYDTSDEITDTPLSPPDPSDFDDHGNEDTATVTVQEPDVTVDKDVSGQAADTDAREAQPGDAFTYTLDVTNSGDVPAYDVVVDDANPDIAGLTDVTLVTPAPTGVTVDDGDGSDGSLAWTIDEIPAGGTVTLQYTAKLAASTALTDGQTIANTASVPEYWGATETDRTANPSIEYRDYTGNSDTVTLTVDLPELAVTKTTSASGNPDQADAEIGQPFGWRVVVANAATTAAAKDVDVVDTLPPNWTYVPDSAQVSGGLGQVDPTVTADAGGDTLTWTDLTDLAHGASVTITFQATPSLDAADDPGTGATHPHVNSAQAEAHDASGGTRTYADDDDAQAILRVPDLELTKTPDSGDAVAGDSSSYSIVIHNAGDGTARNLVVTDDLDARAGYTADAATATPATGFAEESVTPDGGTGGATRIVWTIASLGPDDSVTIAVPVALAANLADGVEIANHAGVVADEEPTSVGDDGSLDVATETDLAVAKTATPTTAVAGSELTYTLRVDNDGPSDAQNVQITDPLPSQVTFVSADDDCELATGTVTCDVGTLAAGDHASYEVVVDVAPGATASIANTASVTTDTTDTDGTNDDASLTTPISTSANLAITKTAAADTANQGDTVSYALEVTNAGPSDAAGVTVSDPLPAGTSFVSASSDCGYDDPTDTVTCTPSAPLGAGAHVDYTVTLQMNATGAHVNTATVSSTTPDPDSSDDADDAKVTVGPTVDLELTKSGPAHATAGGSIVYSLVVTNHGPSDATGVTVTDTLPAGVSFASSDGGCTDASGTLTCPVGALAKDASKTIEITVDAPVALAEQTLVNDASVSGNEHEADDTNNDAEATTQVDPSADLGVVKTAAAPSGLLGERLDYKLVVTNHGPSVAENAVVTDDLPVGTEFIEADPAVGACHDAGTTVTCDLGDLAVDASTEVIVGVRLSALGDQANQAHVSSDTDDPEPSNDDDEATVHVDPAADLVLTKDGPARVAAGGTATYTLAVENRGPSTATGVTVEDTLAAGTSFVSSDPGTCTAAAGGVVHCALADLPAGGQARIEITVRAPVALAGQTLTNAATVGADEGDPHPEDDGDTATTTVDQAADVGIVKTATRPAAGGEVTFTLVVTNHGPSVARGVTVSDVLPAGITYRSSHSSQGACPVVDGQAVVCGLGNLAVGASAQITIGGRVGADRAGQRLANTATATTSTPDPQPANNRSSATVEVQPGSERRIDVRITKRQLTAKPLLGRPVSYLITAVNHGPDQATNVVVTDTVGKTVRGVRAKSSQGRCVVRSGVVRCAAGTLEPGASAQVRVRLIPRSLGVLSDTATVVADGHQAHPEAGRWAVKGYVRTARGARITLHKTARPRTARRGQTVRFRLVARVRGGAVANLRVCDRLPRGLTFRAARHATFHRGVACWHRRFAPPGTYRFTIWARVGSDAAARVVNVARARATGMRWRRARAAVQIAGMRFPHAVNGGVTG